MIAFCESFYLLFIEVNDALWVSNGFTSVFLLISMGVDNKGTQFNSELKFSLWSYRVKFVKNEWKTVINWIVKNEWKTVINRNVTFSFTNNIAYATQESSLMWNCFAKKTYIYGDFGWPRSN